MECSVFFGDDGAESIGSEPLVVRITLLSKVKSFALWVILLPLLLLRENRARKALWILLPYYFWMALVAGASTLGGPFGLGTAFGTVIPLLVFLGGFLLLGQRIQKGNGWLVLLAAVLFVAVVHGIWIWSGPVEPVQYFAVASAVLSLLVLVSFVLARLCCRRRYGGVKLSLFLLLFLVVACVGVLSAIAVGMSMPFDESSMGGRSILLMLAGMAVWFTVIGFAIYLIALSFLVVPLATEFYRSRLCGLLKLKRDVPTVVPLPPPSAAQP